MSPALFPVRDRWIRRFVRGQHRRVSSTEEAWTRRPLLLTGLGFSEEISVAASEIFTLMTVWKAVISQDTISLDVFIVIFIKISVLFLKLMMVSYTSGLESSNGSITSLSSISPERIHCTTICGVHGNCDGYTVLQFVESTETATDTLYYNLWGPRKLRMLLNGSNSLQILYCSRDWEKPRISRWRSRNIWVIFLFETCDGFRLCEMPSIRFIDFIMGIDISCLNGLFTPSNSKVLSARENHPWSSVSPCATKSLKVPRIYFFKTGNR